MPKMFGCCAISTQLRFVAILIFDAPYCHTLQGAMTKAEGETITRIKSPTSGKAGGLAFVNRSKRFVNGATERWQ